VLRRILSVPVVTVLLLVAGGCGGNSSDNPSSSDTASEATTTKSVVEESSVRAGALDEIRADYKLNFTGVSWYTPPGTLKIEGATLVARTGFYPDDEGRELGNQLCNALNGNYVLAKTANYGLDGVTVYAQDDPVASASDRGTC
jgi:hypothetical protein